MLIGADLCIQLGREVVFDPQRPLADRPVVPDAAGPVTHLRAAEREVLEVAREAVEVFALTKATGLDVELLVEEFLLVPHLRQACGLATAPDFLGRSEAADPWVVDPVIADIVAIALGNRQLEFSVVPAQDFLQIQVRAQAELIAVTRGAVMVVAAVQVGADFAHVVEREAVALLFQCGTRAVPIAEHPF